MHLPTVKQSSPQKITYACLKCPVGQYVKIAYLKSPTLIPAMLEVWQKSSLTPAE